MTVLEDEHPALIQWSNITEVILDKFILNMNSVVKNLRYRNTSLKIIDNEKSKSYEKQQYQVGWYEIGGSKFSTSV